MNRFFSFIQITLLAAILYMLAIGILEVGKRLDKLDERTNNKLEWKLP